MDYYSGTVSSITDIRDELFACLTTSGYTISGDNITKSGSTIDIRTTLTDSVDGNRSFRLFPRLSGVDAGLAFKVFQPNHGSAIPFDWPATYECFIYDNPNEVYFIINYQTDFFQTIAFGDSPMPGVASCFWLSAPAVTGHAETTATASNMSINILLNQFNSSGGFCGGMMAPYGVYRNALENAWVTSFAPAGTGTNIGRCQFHNAYQLFQSPSPFTTAPLLVPIDMIVNRATTNHIAMAGRMNNCRHIRLDNHNPKDILVYGSDNWKLYPIYRKNDTLRDGNVSGAPHSGTLGIALKV